MADKDEVLEALKKEAVDLENIPLEEVFQNLRCNREGLTSQDAQRRLEIFGYNKLEEKHESKLLKFLGFMWNPLSWVMEAAAIMAICLANGGGKPPDWQDFVGIIALLLINSTISFIEENNAGNAAAALMARLAPKAKIYAVSITIRIVLGFMLLALIWKFDFPPFMVLIIAILNDGTIMTISKDRVKPSPLPDSWKLSEIFATGIFLGGYLAMMTVIFFWAAYETDFFPRVFGVATLEKGVAHDDFKKLASAVYLQVSTISQALIFVTRARSWSFIERPGLLLVVAFLLAQLVATLIAVYANWSFAAIEGIGWGWAGVVWLYNLVFYIPLDFLKFSIRYALSGKAWDLLLEQRIAFTKKTNFGKEERERKWAQAQRTLHGLHPPETHYGDRSSHADLNQIEEEARRRAEMARLRELRTLKGHVESVVKMKNLDIETIQQSYTV